MLFNFSIKNYKNFKNKETIYFNIEKNRNGDYLDKDKIKDNTFEKDKERFLKTIAVYGANGTGKSNLIKALFFIKEFILRAPFSGMPNMQIANDFWLKGFKLDNKTINEPSTFEVEFSTNKKHYKYFFSCNNLKVFEEELDIFNEETNRFNSIFVRNEKLTINNEKLNEEIKNVKNQLRENCLFLSLLISANIDFAIQIQEFLINKITIINTDAVNNFNILNKNTNEDKEEIINFLNLMDINISGIKYETQNITDKNIFFERLNNKNENILFNYFEESQGTLKIFNLMGDLLKTIKNGGIVFVDELDCRLHIKLFKYLIELFNKNENKAQLFFTTHNTTILNKRYDLFRRDQIIIINKEDNNESTIYSLADVKGIQKNANYETLLLDGLVGGNPIIGD